MTTVRIGAVRILYLGVLACRRWIVATGMKGMAFRDANHRIEQSDQRAAVADRFQGVLTARGGKATARRKERTDPRLVHTDQSDHRS